MTPSELRHIREQAGMSQAALAQVLGTSMSAISRWESGSRPIPPIAVKLIRTLLRVGEIPLSA